MVPSLLWLVLKSAAILYSKGKLGLQLTGRRNSLRLARGEMFLP
jgi:hypothetical protein